MGVEGGRLEWGYVEGVGEVSRGNSMGGSKKVTRVFRVLGGGYAKH